MVTKTSISDIPCSSEVNDFGTERYVKGLIKFIENSSAPITIALQGEWGSGKTSLMNRLKQTLCSADGPFVGIEINTWEYSMLSSPETTVFRIMEQLILSLAGNNSKAKTNWSLFAKKAGNAIFRGLQEGVKALPGVGSAAAMAMAAANVPNQILDERGEDVQITLSDLKKSLEEAIAQSLVNGKRGVIVFVDDLDRLNPPVAVEILELLKNIFSLKDCIFVLAIDYEVVVKGLEPKFGKLTDKNEREFRSFFDKIIQVPFSLPVSSYRPMNFVLDSLSNIGYITGLEKEDCRLTNPIEEIVEYSVGKNPRSIKRLINTLSLLSCIDQCDIDKTPDAAFTSSIEGRIAKFAIVALQVCYPKIYRMLASSTDFTEWDQTLARKFNIAVSDDGNAKPNWEEILQAACSTDKFLEQHFNDIRSLFRLIQQTVENHDNSQEVKFGEHIRSIIDKSSVTGVSEPVHSSEFNQRRLIDKLHEKVSRRIKEKRADLDRVRLKNNNGNGGFIIPLPKEGSVEVKLRPKALSDKISCELELSTQVNRPEVLLGKSFEEMLQNEKVNKMLSAFDDTIAPLLQNVSYFEGRIYPQANTDTYFRSFSEEQAFRCHKGWIPKQICLNASYFISLPNESLFEDNAVVEIIADVVIANYNLRVDALALP